MVGPRIGVLVVALLVGSTAWASPEWQARPFAGATLGGGTTLLDLENASGQPNVVVGVGGGLLGDVVGIDVDLGHAPGFFQSGERHLVSRSRVTTLTGNVIVGLSRRRTEYTLRPYFVGGFGLMQARINDAFGVLRVTMTRPAVDVGGGVSGALSDRTGLSWELRHFRSVGRQSDPRGLSFGPEELSFWRANMALVIRY